MRRPPRPRTDLRSRLRTAERRCKFLAKLLRVFVVREARLDVGVDEAEIRYLVRLGRAVLKREGIRLPRRSSLVGCPALTQDGES